VAAAPSIVAGCTQARFRLQLFENELSEEGEHSGEPATSSGSMPAQAREAAVQVAMSVAGNGRRSEKRPLADSGLHTHSAPSPRGVHDVVKRSDNVR
jgi:hypothetical protein